MNHKLSQDAIGASEVQSGIQRVVFARARGPGRITVATSLHRAATCGNVKIRVAGIGLSRADREVRALLCSVGLSFQLTRSRGRSWPEDLDLLPPLA